jgi:5-methyltetrahydrofolate--homocysteine methyltransferase
MIVIGEKINGALPGVRRAINTGDDAYIRNLAYGQAKAGCDFLDVCAGGHPGEEYDTLARLVKVVQDEVDIPVCVDSPDVDALARLLGEDWIKKPGFINSVSEESDKCERLFPILANTDWRVIGLTCDSKGVPADAGRKLDIAKSIIDKASGYGVDISHLYIDPCIMALSATPEAFVDFVSCIQTIKEFAPEVNVIGAISNVSHHMPARGTVNRTAMAMAVAAGLDAVILDPLDREMIAVIKACEALLTRDKSGRVYNKLYRAGWFARQTGNVANFLKK